MRLGNAHATPRRTIGNTAAGRESGWAKNWNTARQATKSAAAQSEMSRHRIMESRTDEDQTAQLVAVQEGQRALDFREGRRTAVDDEEAVGSGLSERRVVDDLTHVVA